MQPIRLKIDGVEVTANAETTILQAAQSAGRDIPTLCHEPKLTTAASCRLCVVEDKKSGKLLASCAMTVADGMVLETESERVVQARRMVLELLLANHPLDCLTCEKSGVCKLQEYAYRYKVASSPFAGEKRDYPLDESNPFFVRDYNKCILCGKCVGVCHEVQGYGVIDFVERGFSTIVGTPYEDALERTPCVFCGMCVELCPVGALYPKKQRFAGRSWEITETQSTCVYCGVGCQLNFQVKDGKIIGVTVPNEVPNNGEACVKGKFGWDFIQHDDRLTKPLIRKDGQLTECSWEEALRFVATQFKALGQEYGSSALAGLSSAKCTNEENYLFQKFVRSVLGTHNVDHCARLCHASTVTGLSSAFGSAAMTNSIQEIEDAQVIFVIGSNTTEAHPVIGYRIKSAVRKGHKLIVADPRRIDLVNHATLWLRQTPGTDVALINGLLHVIVAEGLFDGEFIQERTAGFEQIKEIVKDYPPELVSKITGVPAQDIVSAARLYAQAESASIIYSMGITQHTTGTDNVLSLANLAMATGNVGKPNAGVNPLRGQNNVQGACDVGALPNVYPGYQSVSAPEHKEKFASAWGNIPQDDGGLTATEMIDAIDDGQIRALYVMGENPVLSDPDTDHVRKVLADMDFLVVQDIFLSETAQLADVVLPACSFAEKEGTFTNTERRIQKVNPAILPIGESKADWEILTALAQEMGVKWDHKSSEDIFREIAALTPIYAGVSYERIKESGGIQWPCPDVQHQGTKYLHENQFTRGKGQFNPVTFIAPNETPDQEYPYLLTTGRKLNHFHTGTMSRRSTGLDGIHPEELVELNPEDAKKLSVQTGEMIVITSRRSSIEAKVGVTERVPQGVIFMSFHFREAAANRLTNPARDGKAKIPEFKVCAVRVSKCV